MIYTGNFFTCDDQKGSRSDNKTYEEVKVHFHFLGCSPIALAALDFITIRWTSACGQTTLVTLLGVRIENVKKLVKHDSGEYPFSFVRIKNVKKIYKP